MVIIASGWVQRSPTTLLGQCSAKTGRQQRNFFRNNCTLHWLGDPEFKPREQKMTDKSGKTDRISRMAHEQQQDFLRRSSLHFLECAIHLCATNMSISELAARLEKQAQYLRQFG
ncbi:MULTISPECIES: hypothetical protein [Agrobacterium]|uniref:hypothetical protein n=1 Tax=Agrobacterium TaxID=357 RepID=UPI001CB79462|nr:MULTISPECIES: hypothetical protein [Agrobacterium]MDA5243366.1 hypothetical protein [Agrobacterium sp. MAFF310724]MDA5248688.1 hypothetical protein [Agrobacterium sp. MAFF210268]NTE82402.1 hypothetical protein [Agrobacterium tumefaciens]WCA58361.1 hypothetical protein G6M16_011825 [Agrobacterium tumefaciens]